MEFFRPGAVVLQMGADSISGDKLGGFNLTLEGNTPRIEIVGRSAKSQVMPSVLVT